MKIHLAKRHDTILLRSVAILLILNSHLDPFYPIPYIGTGGAIGNSLFFMLSGFGLYLSTISSQDTFRTYFKKRILRIYPSLWLALIALDIPLMFIVGTIHEKTIFEICRSFFLPPFWFLKAIIVYYVIFFSLIRNYTRNKLFLYVLGTLLIYILSYLFLIDLNSWSIEKLPFVLNFYLLFFFFGVFLGSINNSLQYRGPTDYFMVIVFFILIYFHKFLMTKGLLSQYQIVQHIFMFPLSYYLFRIARSPVARDIMTSSLAPAVRNISKITLEIYIVHTILGRLRLYEHYQFPTSIFIFLSATFTVALLINLTVARTKRFIIRNTCA